MPAILLQHGIIDSAEAFIVNHENKAPAFYLAEKGYDVWLGNQRGSYYGRRHLKLDPDS